MEERRGARHVTQRQLEEERPTGAPAEPAVPTGPDPPSDPPPSPGAASDPGPSEPSDARLRERQRLWWRERTRFETAKAARRGRDDASK